MKLFNELWNDESGLVMSAETVTLGTVGVLGAVVGMNAANNAVNAELKEMASAIRSLDQSYAFAGHRGCGAWTAGSCYIQPDVQQSLAEINAEIQADSKTLQQQIEEERKARTNSVNPGVVEPTPTPNQIPVPEPKTNAPVESTTVPPRQ